MIFKKTRLTLLMSIAALGLSQPSLAADETYQDPHYQSPSASFKQFFSGDWEASFQAGYAKPNSSTMLDDAAMFGVGIYHDLGSRMALELQYLRSSDFEFPTQGASTVSFATQAAVASLRGYGKPGPLGLVYFGRMGFGYYDNDFDNGDFTTDLETGTTVMFGFGAERALNDTTTISVDLAYFHNMLQGGQINTLNLGIRHHLASW